MGKPKNKDLNNKRYPDIIGYFGGKGLMRENQLKIIHKRKYETSRARALGKRRDQQNIRIAEIENLMPFMKTLWRYDKRHSIYEILSP